MRPLKEYVTALRLVRAYDHWSKAALILIHADWRGYDDVPGITEFSRAYRAGTDTVRKIEESWGWKRFFLVPLAKLLI
jgi:hypothetical protein